MLKLGCGLVIGVLAVIPWTGPARAEQPGPEQSSAVTRLESLLRQQQQQIEQLEQQVAAAQQGEQDHEPKGHLGH